MVGHRSPFERVVGDVRPNSCAVLVPSLDEKRSSHRSAPRPVCSWIVGYTEVGRKTTLGQITPVKSLGPYRERSGRPETAAMAKMRGAGAFTIRRLVLSRPEVWQGNCFMGIQLIAYAWQF